MSYRCICNHDGSSYKFSENPETFQEAQDKCERDGGILATRLNKQIYKELTKCCKDQSYFWIGLKENDSCSGNRIYQWLKEDNCINPRWLKIAAQPSNRQCQAVVVKIKSGKTIPHGETRICTNNEKYICKFQNPKIATTTTNRSVLYHVSPNTETTRIATTTSKPVSLVSASKAMTKSSIDTGLIAGLVLGISFFIFLLILLCYCLQKKGYLMSSTRAKETDGNAIEKASKPIVQYEIPDQLYQTVADNTYTMSENSLSATNRVDSSTEFTTAYSLPQESDYASPDQTGSNPYQEISSSTAQPASRSDCETVPVLGEQQEQYNILYKSMDAPETS